jgi:hypothetical protein
MGLCSNGVFTRLTNHTDASVDFLLDEMIKIQINCINKIHKQLTITTVEVEENVS